MDPKSAGRCLALHWMVLLGLLISGCSGSSRPGRENQTDPGAVDEVDLAPIDEAGFANVLEKNRGKVVLVDFWATWCPECLELLPHTVQLYKQFADQGLTVISVALDDAEEEAKALEILTEKGASFQNFISKYGGSTRSTEVFAIPAGLPHLKIYDRHGRLRKTFAAGTGTTIDPDQIDRAVAELLAETP